MNNSSSQSTFGMINCIKELKSILSLKPFTPENCDALYAMRNGSCNLVLKDEPRDKPPYSLDSYEHLKTRKFDELWDMLSIPKYKMDKSYRDNLNNSHIG
jgi:hypothetical protein